MPAFLIKFISEIGKNPVMELVVIAIVVDTLFGVLRAAKERKFNSNFGINGAIRKCGMIITILTLAIVDKIVSVNLIGFIPEAVRAYFPNSVQAIGTMEFFGILFIAYETISILKNMTLCGLPVKKIWIAVKVFLGKYTEELPNDEGTV